MSKKQIIEGRSIFTEPEGGFKPKSDIRIERQRKMLEDLTALMDSLDGQPWEFIIEATDMGLVYVLSDRNKREWITEFKIKRIEEGYQSLQTYYNMVYDSVDPNEVTNEPIAIIPKGSINGKEKK